MGGFRWWPPRSRCIIYPAAAHWQVGLGAVVTRWCRWRHAAAGFSMSLITIDTRSASSWVVTMGHKTHSAVAARRATPRQYRRWLIESRLPPTLSRPPTITAVRQPNHACEELWLQDHNLWSLPLLDALKSNFTDFFILYLSCARREIKI